ncbi:NAD-dependent malic enzyme [uncultured archaeon]|nr:NAD-dependent malic enzyme [uncultured archaeon]
MAYTPGVADPCLAISKNSEDVYKYTMKGNTVAVISNGTAVLGLGNIGARASIPVMEGKALLFKQLGGVNAFPICINEKDPVKLVEIIASLEPVFGGFNLEDIKSPECFYVERELKKRLSIPVMHDDQHATAIVVSAGLINALKLAGKGKEVKIVIQGAGAAGNAVTKLLIKQGFKNIIVVDKKGILDRDQHYEDEFKKELAELTNHHNFKGPIDVALKDADVLIGLSGPNSISKSQLSLLTKTNPIVFALANPIPEISIEDAKSLGITLIATGRSDLPNQINNVLAFPGIFKGVFQYGKKEITDEMKINAAKAIAKLIKQEELNPDYFIPRVFNKRVVKAVARAMKK